MSEDAHEVDATVQARIKEYHSGSAVVPEASGSAMASMMERLALNPQVDVQKLEKLLEMQIQVRAIEAAQEYSAAMARVQMALPVVLKDAYNEQTKSPYATLGAIAAAIKPVYAREGFSISFTEGVTAKPDHVRVCATVRHRAGHQDERPFVDVAVDRAGLKGNDNKTLTHAEGSSFMYGRRYLTCMVFDVATGTDNDGNGARPAEVISAEQVAAVEARIVAVGTSRPVFLRWLGIEALERLRVRDYERAMRQLDVLGKARR